MTTGIAFDVERCDHLVESDGTVLLTIKIDPRDSRSFLSVSPDAGGRLFVAPAPHLIPDPGPLSLSVNYREAAMALADSKFFEQSSTWSAVGSDADFLAWIRKQKCWIERKPGHVCSGDIVAAHVRRVASGSGVAVKPDFSAMPLCDSAHKDQHQHGESAIGGREKVDRAVGLYLRRWSALTLLAKLGYENWAHVPPNKLRTWATGVDLVAELPAEYRRMRA